MLKTSSSTSLFRESSGFRCQKTCCNPVILPVNHVAVTGTWWLGYVTCLVCSVTLTRCVPVERQCLPISLFSPPCCYATHSKMITISCYKLRSSCLKNFVDSILTLWWNNGNYLAPWTHQYPIARVVKHSFITQNTWLVASRANKRETKQRNMFSQYEICTSGVSNSCEEYHLL